MDLNAAGGAAFIEFLMNNPPEKFKNITEFMEAYFIKNNKGVVEGLGIMHAEWLEGEPIIVEYSIS